ncbi:MAG: bifunctional riboflavin kinase/FAD synthetase [Rhizobiaceae bacterium]
MPVLPEHLKGGVVAIGNFDGVHLGHRAVLDRALAIAGREQAPSVVLTFEPHPRTLFRPDKPVFRLTPAPLKANIMRDLGFDAVVEQTFDHEFSQMFAADFVEKLLGESLGARHVVTGHDFHFGRGRQGTPKFLADHATSGGMEVTLVEPFLDDDGEIISSTRIRDALARGDIELANRLSGRSWFVRGSVVAGKQLGRTLGYPTANMLLPAEARLYQGIYAVRVRLANGGVHDGVASFGRRPTFDNGEILLETYLFDFSDDIYGMEIEVEFHKFLRSEEKFDSAEDLVAQMDRDCVDAKTVLDKSQPPEMTDG